MDNASPEELEKLKRDTGIPHLPTQLTYECRMAIADEGPRAYEWSDKPHRVVYDLCQEIEAAAARRPALPDREAVAREVYNTFSDQVGFVPWVEGGNSDKQFEARRVANRILALSPAQAEREGWVSTGYECEILQGGEYQAGASSENYDDVVGEANHYAAVYGQDGPVEVLMWETARRAMLSAAPKETT